MTIILRKFNINNINRNDLIIILGMVTCGKSTLCKDILYQYYDIPIGVIITNNKDPKKTYNYIPPLFVHKNYDKNRIKNFINRQNELLNNNEFDTSAFIVLDDCLYSHNYNKDKYFQLLIKSSKIYNFMCIIQTQYLKYINDDLIKNTDYLFIMKEPQEVNRRKIYEQFQEYLGIQYSVFMSLMNDYTEDYNILVLDIKNKSNRLEDKLYWYKSSIHNNFKICSEDSWKYSNHNYINETPIKPINRNIFY